MNYARRDRLAMMLMAVFALGLGACRHVEEAGHYGSIKDDHVTGSVAKPAKVAVAAPRAAAPVKVAAPAVVAPAPAQPAAKAPAPAMAMPAPTPASAAPATPTIVAPAVEQPLPPVDDAAGAARMLSEGQAFFDSGKVLQARRRFIAAMNGPNPEVLLALGRSYDTYYLSRLPASDAAPDMQRALVLYERALERGANTATADLERTRAILKIPR